MLTARPASHSGNDACADAATASPHGVDTRACTALTVRTIVAMPLKSGSPASFITFDGLPPEVEHFAIRFAEAAENKVPLVRIHSECVTGDVFGSLRCDCGSPLEQSIERCRPAAGSCSIYARKGEASDSLPSSTPTGSRIAAWISMQPTGRCPCPRTHASTPTAQTCFARWACNVSA